MIHSATPIVTPLAKTVLCTFNCFSRFEKWGRTDGRTTCAKIIIPTGRDFGLAEWIKKEFCLDVNYSLINICRWDNQLYLTLLISFANLE